MLTAFINAFNLLPVPMLDGGGVASLLLQRVHPRIARSVGIFMLAGMVGLAIQSGDPILLIFVPLTLVAFVQTSALKIDAALQPMSRAGALAITLAYFSLIAVYVWLSIDAMQLLSLIEDN